MICAAVSGLTASITKPAITRLSQANNGIWLTSCLGNACENSSTMLIAVPMLPKPETSSDKVQKSVLCPGENVCEVAVRRQTTRRREHFLLHKGRWPNQG